MFLSEIFIKVLPWYKLYESLNIVAATIPHGLATAPGVNGVLANDKVLGGKLEL